MDTRLRSDINITPLIDIVLVLLIVSMTLVPALPHALATALPRSAGAGPPLPVLRLTLLKDGHLDYGNGGVGSLTAALASRPERVVLRVHRDLPLSVPTGVLDDIQGLRPGLKVSLVSWE